MSNTIDEKVVEMRFNNRDFEKNAKESISTLDKLKKSLKLDGIAKGLDDIGASAKGINMSPLVGAVETVHAKFSALEVIGITALANITNSAINTGKQLVKSLSIDQIASGWQKFGSKTGSVATLVAQGYALEEVNGQLDRLNWFTDETSYNFTDMVSNIAKFTASGKGLTESVTAMEGIANWAALSGQNAATASHAMYQLSQAMSAGVMRKEDYKSIQNASMDTQEFRQKCIDAAIALGTLKDNGDGTFKSLTTNVKNGDFTISQFADHLTQDAWLTSDVMMKVFGDYSSAVDQIYEYAQEHGITASQAIEELGMEVDAFGLKAFKAAQQARTWGDAVDSVKDAVSTGWMNTFEIIFGNSEEATQLWTDLANSMWDIFASGGESRNNLLKNWRGEGEEAKKYWQDMERAARNMGDAIDFEKDGRAVLLEGFWNTWESFFGDGDEYLGILGTIKEAFRDIFPPMTFQRLLDLTKGFRDLTVKLKPTEEQLGKLKSVFKGFFSVIDIGVTAVKSIGKGILSLAKNLTGFSGGLFDGAASLGEWVSGLRDSIKETDIFGQIVEKITGVIQNAINKFKEFGSAVAAKIHFPSLENLGNILNSIWEFVSNIANKLGEVLSKIGSGIGEFFSKTDMGSIMKLLNGGLLASALVKISGLIKNGSGILENFKDTIGGIKDMLTGINEKKSEGGLLDALKNGLSSLQEAVNVNKIIKIAAAVAILAGSLKVISTIDSDKIETSLVALGGVFAELVGAMAIFDKFDITGSDKGMGSMILLAASVLILSSALKKLGDLNWSQIGRGLTAMGGVMLELIGFTKLMGNSTLKTGSMIGLIALATSMKIFASAMADFATFDWSQIGRGLAAMGGVLLELVGFTKLIDGSKLKISSMTSLIAMAVSLKIFASAMADFATFNWDQIKTGLTAMGGALIEIAIATRIMPTNMVGIGAGLLIVSGALHIMATALEKFGNLSGDQIIKGLGSIGILLTELAVALNFMKGTLAGSAALLIAAVALTVLSVPITILSKIKWTSLAKSLIAIAGALVVVGVAGAAFGAVAPLILLGSVALAGMGAAMMLLVPALAAVGAMSIKDIAKGILGLATAFVVLGGVAALLGLVSPLILAFGAAILAVSAGVALFGAGLVAIGVGLSMIGGALEVFVTSVGNAAESLSENIAAIIEVIISSISSIVAGIIELTPQFVEAGFTILMSFLQGINDNIYQITTTVGEIITNFLNALAEQLPIIVEAGMNLLVEFINGMAASLEIHGPEVGTALYNLFVAAIDTVISFLTGGAVTSLKDAGQKIMDSGLIQAIKDKASSLKESFSTAISDAKTAVLNKLSEWTDAGSQMINGLIDGVKSKASELVEAAKGVVSSAIQAAKNLLGIASPSKVFAEMGRYVDEGFVIGIKNYAGNVVNATENLGKSAVNSMSNAVKNISGIINRNIDSQPTIRPVLDLTDVEKGAGQLNTMFTRTQAMRVSASMNNMIADENQNGSVQSGAVYQFTQNNYSPKALSRLEIYRQTRNQFAAFKEATMT